MTAILRFIKKHPFSLIFALLTLAVMWLIFSFSAQESGESSAVSKGVSYFISSIIVSGFNKLSEAEKEAKILSLVPIVRKTAHFLVFCSLGFCSFASVRSFYMESAKKFKNGLHTAFILLFCLLYAASDEFHQLFVSGRSGEIRDVLIDFGGAVFGVAAALLFFAVLAKILPSLKQNKNYQK